MKHIYALSLMLFTIISSNLYGQTFAPVGAEWIMGYTVPSTLGLVSSKTINVIGDTIINGTTCQIISGFVGPHSPHSFGPYNYVYEQGGKVYAYYDQINQFQKVFDFDAQSGENWDIVVHENGTNAVFDTFRITIDSTFIEVLDGMSTKSYFYSLTFMPNEGSQCLDFYDDFFQGTIHKANNKLGAGFYLFPVPTSPCTADIYELEWLGNVRCYTDADITYSNLGTNIPSCNYQNITIEEIEEPVQSLIWDSSLNLIRMKNELKGHFTVYTYDGRIVLRENHKHVLNVSQLDKGIYIVEFLSNTKRQNIKIYKE